ncbi:Zn-ribbon domain-containing OB-fold protein [Mycolicibacterium phocaicum]|uniref:Zn-ribbon domain-containing OB-fold protein n=1 Tax=Mycolicibacterium phocaicum TaxID=319706 RepID=UPI001CFA3B12|nr:OB-fold domain-containing protein [Mycolicibacterium phocaicum]UCZ62495.1 OB-fold domain-containing protein [Mycolicibacterium phocaicum]
MVRDDRSAPFFDAAARDQLVTKRCSQCSQWLGLEARTCPSCGGFNLTWEPVLGSGRLITWSIVAAPPSPVFADQVPFAVGYVELDEGPWVNARIVDVRDDQLRAGMPLAVRFVHPTPEDDAAADQSAGESYPVFGPAGEQSDR